MSPGGDAVRYSRQGAAALLEIDRPERRNAIDGAAATALREGFEAFCADQGARVLVVHGAGGEAFCAGADLKAITTLDPDASGGPLGFTRLQSPKPTIAAVGGWCVAGGLEVALWCDLRIASPTARFGLLERRWGVPLIDGGTQRLPLVVGLGRALDMILTGRVVEAREARDIGLVNELADNPLARSLELAEQIAAFPQPTVMSDRDAVYAGLGIDLAAEADLGRAAVMQGVRGAGRFAAGEGRGGRFGVDSGP